MVLQFACGSTFYIFILISVSVCSSRMTDDTIDGSRIILYDIFDFLMKPNLSIIVGIQY